MGHTDGTCFQPGGGMEGRHEEYMSNKGCIHAMFAKCLENAFSLPDHPLPPDPNHLSDSPTLSPILDDELIVPPVTNLCVTSFVPNSDICDDLYICCDPKFFSPLALTSVDFKSAMLVFLVTLFNALLDSGCTHHIIQDRSLFHNYTTQSISVDTANCGSLAALGTGDVVFHYPFGDQHVTFTL